MCAISISTTAGRGAPARRDQLSVRAQRRWGASGSFGTTPSPFAIVTTERLPSSTKPAVTADIGPSRNFVADVLASELAAWDARGVDTSGMHWSMAGNTMVDLHVSEMPPASLQACPSSQQRRVHPDPVRGGLLADVAGGRFDQRVRVAWHEGTLFAPPTFWYHQHLNPGAGRLATWPSTRRTWCRTSGFGSRISWRPICRRWKRSSARHWPGAAATVGSSRGVRRTRRGVPNSMPCFSRPKRDDHCRQREDRERRQRHGARVAEAVAEDRFDVRHDAAATGRRTGRRTPAGTRAPSPATAR